MKMLKQVVIAILLASVGCSVFAKAAYADTATDNALSFLKSKQDAAGRITTGFSAPSQWSAIAFAINGVDVSTVKSSDKSLLDFLLTDIPTNNSATDWESRILALVAIGQNPTNFGGTNYVTKLENFYTSNQIGETCSINDDVFGLLALLAAGNASTTQIKQSTLDFIISKQDPTDGGFGFSAPGCAWYATSADMTGAALQALVEAKNKGFSSAGLDTAIQKAKDYLIAHKNADGGYGYFGSSDPDTTGWVLQAFNVSGMKDSSEGLSARTYLLAQQSATNRGFMAFDWGTNALVSNATTTAQAIIALSGKGWIVKVYDPSVQTPVTTLAPTNPPTSTPTTSSTSNNSSSPTSTPMVTPTPTTVPVSQQIRNTPTFSSGLVDDTATIPAKNASDTEPQKDVKNDSQQGVLGIADEALKKDGIGNNTNSILISGLFTGFGVLFVFIYFTKQFILRKINQ